MVIWTSRLVIYGYFCLLLFKWQVIAEPCSTAGDVRLVDGVTTYEGRVEICLYGEWGTICDHNWGESDARVVCKQLGLPSEHPDALYRYGGGSGPIHYRGFQCTGTETQLAHCQVDRRNSSATPITNCRHFEDAGVECTSVPCVENAVRLNEEVLQVCHNQQWGLVCANGGSWDHPSVQVACTQLGIPSALPRSARRKLLFYDAPVILNDIACTGSETNILNCTEDGYGVFTTCSNIAVAQCEVQQLCSGQNSIRLTQFHSSNTIGRLEVCAGGIWGSVCSNGVTTALAEVACRELNHAAGGTLYAENDYSFILGELVPIRRTNVVCTGNETSFSECSFDGADGDETCTHKNDVIVVCIARQCTDAEVHLVNGKTSTDGRVEICVDGLWGSVCDDRWDYRDAEVVCRQLQFDGPSYPLLSHGNLGSSPLIHLDDVHCEGTENSLTECSHRGLGVYDCREGLDEAGVICTNTSCVDRTVHLVGGDDISRGRVEYCFEGTWYSVCASGWDETGEEARVVCRTLGYSFESVVVDYGRGSSPILPLRFDCNVDDTDLSSCTRTMIDTSQCPHVAGVNCGAFCLTVNHRDCEVCGTRDMCWVFSGATPICNCYSDCYEYGDCCTDVSHVDNCLVPECETGTVRLVGGTTNSTGRLEICANGVWGRVCNKLQYWGLDNAMVVCRQLGFSDKDAYVVHETAVGLFGESVRAPLLGEVHCTGIESELLECSHSSIGQHSCGRGSPPVPDVVISCLENTSCSEGDIRLRDGFDPSNGRVEYCHHRTWGTVCSEGWDDNDAKVVCHQLGYNPDVALIGLPIDENLPVILTRVDCVGTEQKLGSCETATPTTICSGAGVTCGKSSNIERCSSRVAVTPVKTLSFGTCEVYTEPTEVCTSVLLLGIDYVFITRRLGSQSSLSASLNKNIETVRQLIATHDKECVEQVLQVLCSYYLPHCGNATHPQSPSSICQKECDYVQETCQPTWQAASLAFSGLKPFLSCADTSTLLNPLPHCCTGAGVNLPTHSSSTVSLSTSVPFSASVTTTPSSGGADRKIIEQGNINNKEDGSFVGIVVGIVVFILLAAMVLGLMLLVFVAYHKMHKNKQIERITLDIMAVSGTSSSTTVENTEHEEPLEPDDKNQLIDNNLVDPNPYSVPLPAGSHHQGNSLAVYENRPRIPSHHVRQLTRGKFIVESEDITLLECIGEGEFGIVYKARLNTKSKERNSREVAVKTLKGTFNQVEVEKFVEESLKMSRFKHAHVMGLIGLCLDGGPAPLIIMPFMANGSLLKYLKMERDNLIVTDENDEDEVESVRKRLIAMCCQIACGMEYLADEKYVHRDLAARNCMIDMNFVIKITDFGLSEDVFERNYFRHGGDEEAVKLPVKWMAPESLSDGHFSEKSDVWSYGVTMWEIFSGGKAPYPGTNPLSLMQNLENGYRMPPPCNAACTKEIYRMMSKCWEMLPGKRPNFKEIHSSVSKYIVHIGGYLEMGLNPFTGWEERKLAAVDEEPEGEFHGDEGGDLSIPAAPPSS